jgi:protease-4
LLTLSAFSGVYLRLKMLTQLCGIVKQRDARNIDISRVVTTFTQNLTKGFFMFGRSSRDPSNEDLVEKFTFEVLKEQRRARRWRIFFMFLTFAYVGFFIFFAVFGDKLPSLGDTASSGEGHTAVVRVEGVIAADTEASADKIITGLRRAFEHADTKGIVIRINSPGGSPVQAGYVNDEIVRLREKYPDTPLYAVVTDVCASGGYYIAAAADKIYADKASIVGSIGVLMNSFGFTGAMEKLGIERRLYTAGENKAMLDPFSPEKDSDVQHAQSVLDEMHQQFIDTVKQGRGERLSDDSRLFSGMWWSGETAKELGLVDELGSTSYVAREIFAAEKTKDFTARKDYLERLAERFGAAMAHVFVEHMQAQSLIGEVQ